MITEIAFTNYSVTDMTRSREFYEGKLGLKPSHAGEGIWVEYEVGPNTFCISTYGQPSTAGASIAFEVDDLDAELARLKELDVQFVDQLIETPVCRMQLIADPDGNQFILHQRKPGHA